MMKETWDRLFDAGSRASLLQPGGNDNLEGTAGSNSTQLLGAPTQSAHNCWKLQGP